VDPSFDLESINSPEDLRAVPDKALPSVAAQIRQRIIRIINKNGGHLASNLGVVELTIALHRVFLSPTDKLVWDTGHQCYTHKLLTGRLDSFKTIRLKDGVSGFPKTTESPHDIVETGHASTSISAALGILAGQDIQSEDGRIVAIIGDGSFTGGLAFEAINHAGHLHKNLIIVLNDNQMSISPNVGALSGYLSRIAATRLYQTLRSRFDTSVKKVPLFGDRMMYLIERMKKGAKAFFFKETLFSDLGFEYVGPIDGHNMTLMQTVFKNVRELAKPVVVHVVTKKGKGYSRAESDPANFHGVSPFSQVGGKLEKKSSISFSEAFSEAIVNQAESDPKIAAVTAAMSGGTGLSHFQERFPDRFFDVGIAEQHAVTFAAGLAISGMKPIVAIYSTFLQRSIDQIIHDVALPGLSVLIIADRAGLVGGDGETHQGVFDVSLLRPVPGLTILSPASAHELELMISYSLSSGGPALIRYPKASCIPSRGECPALVKGRGAYMRNVGGDHIILSTGGILREAMDAANRLAEKGVAVDVFNLRFLKPLDTSFYLDLIKNYESAVLVEDEAETGGIGEMLLSKVAESAAAGGAPTANLSIRGIPETFDGRGTRDELLSLCGLDAAGISEMILQNQPAKRFYRLSKRRP
jgi:1-deoxy-D-xylulose-5-phosphate synthase